MPLGMDLGAFVLSWFPGHVSMGIPGGRAVGSAVLSQANETSCPDEKARSWEALGEARPGQSSLSAGALRYRAWAQSWSSAALVLSVTPCKEPLPQA